MCVFPKGGRKIKLEGVNTCPIILTFLLGNTKLRKNQLFSFFYMCILR